MPRVRRRVNGRTTILKQICLLPTSLLFHSAGLPWYLERKIKRRARKLLRTNGPNAFNDFLDKRKFWNDTDLCKGTNAARHGQPFN